MHAHAPRTHAAKDTHMHAHASFYILQKNGMHFRIVLLMPTVIATAYCKHRHTNRPLNGFRCNGQPFTCPRGVIQASCAHRHHALLCHTIP